MTNHEAAEKIEDMFDAQLDESALRVLLEKLQGLQRELIGESAMAEMRERRIRFKACREARSDEREACAEIAKSVLQSVNDETQEKRQFLDRQEGLTYTFGMWVAADRIEKAIRKRG